MTRLTAAGLKEPLARLTKAWIKEHRAMVAKLRKVGVVRTHRCEGPAEAGEVLGFGRDARPVPPQPRQGAIGGKAVPKGRSQLEIALQAQIEAAGLPQAEYDVPYLIGTRHRIDVCWRDRRLGVEVQGMVHRIKGRFKADITKRATALLQGWTVLEVDGEAIKSGKAIEWIGQLLKR